MLTRYKLLVWVLRHCFLIKCILLILASQNAFATELCSGEHCRNLWVAANGDDTNNCLSEAKPCSTVGRAVSLAQNAGDRVNIKTGRYTTAQPGCSYFGVPGMACFQASGTPANPIILQAAPGHEGQVILDGNTHYSGINLNGHDFIVIQNLEIAYTHSVGIYNGGPAVREVSDDSDFSVGVQVLNNYIHDVVSVNQGSNPGGVRMDNAKDWIVRNNRIDTVCGLAVEGGCRYINSGCVYSYYIWNATIENNQCSNSGALIHWKDHILDDEGNPTLPGSLARYNLGYNLTYGFYISHGNRDPESSNHVVTHNIFYNIDSACMALLTDTANGAQSVNYVFEHNICDGADIGIASLSAQVTRSSGNIFTDVTGYPTSTISDIYRFMNNDDAQLDYSDFNIFAGSGEAILRFPRVNMSNPNSTHIYNSLETWRKADSASNGGSLSLNMESPDSHSIEVHESTLFLNSAIRNYHYPDDSPAIGFMQDGSNAGPYQTGTEVIGLLEYAVKPVGSETDLLDFIPAILSGTKN